MARWFKLFKIPLPKGDVYIRPAGTDDMLSKLGIPGIIGFLFMIGGIVVVAVENLFIAGGLALVIAGLGLLVYGMVTNLLSALGMGGMV